MRRIPLTRAGWLIVTLIVVLGIVAAAAGSGTVAIVAAALFAFTLLLAVGAPVSVRNMKTPPHRGLSSPYIAPREDPHRRDL